MTTLFIFEDKGSEQLTPLTRMRPSYELKCGILTLLEKITAAYAGAEKVALGCRDYLSDTLKEQHAGKLINSTPEDCCLFINGRILADPALAEKMPLTGADEIFINGETLVGARLANVNLPGGKSIEEFLNQLKNKIKTTKINVTLIEYPWQLINHNSSQIEADFKQLWGKGEIKGKLAKEIAIYDKANVVIETDAKVEAFVVIDSRQGPVIIDKSAQILPHTVIEGPAYIGSHTTIKGGAIRGGTSIGPHCKIHGEVSMSIIHGYSNKAHYGFLGNAYLAEWVNLGAGTTNSNLKNNYGTIKITINGKKIDTGKQFAGCFIGDHAKIAIGTKLNTGTIISIFCNLFGEPPAKYVKPFTFGQKKKFKLAKAIEMAELAMERRKIKPSPAYKKLIINLHNRT